MDSTREMLTITISSFVSGAGAAGFYTTLEVMPWLPMFGAFGAMAIGSAHGFKTYFDTIQELNNK